MSASRFLLLTFVAACAGSRNEPAQSATPDTAAAPSVATIAGKERFPIVGVAVLSDSGNRWCAEFPQDTTRARLAIGARVAIVFVEPAEVPAFPAKIAAARDRECVTSFGQPRWYDYSAYDLEPVDSLGYPDAEETPIATLAVASPAAWARGKDDVVHADLDGDGLLEEARRCYADEGVHFSIWTRMRDSTYKRRAHEYYDLGALVDVTCAGIDASEMEKDSPP